MRTEEEGETANLTRVLSVRAPVRWALPEVILASVLGRRVRSESSSSSNSSDGCGCLVIVKRIAVCYCLAL